MGIIHGMGACSSNPYSSKHSEKVDEEASCTCSICMETAVTDAEMLPCGHRFHRDCYKQWCGHFLARSLRQREAYQMMCPAVTCPVCRDQHVVKCAVYASLRDDLDGLVAKERERELRELIMDLLRNHIQSEHDMREFVLAWARLKFSQASEDELMAFDSHLMERASEKCRAALRKRDPDISEEEMAIAEEKMKHDFTEEFGEHAQPHERLLQMMWQASDEQLRAMFLGYLEEIEGAIRVLCEDQLEHCLVGLGGLVHDHDDRAFDYDDRAFVCELCDQRVPEDDRDAPWVHDGLCSECRSSRMNDSHLSEQQIIEPQREAPAGAVQDGGQGHPGLGLRILDCIACASSAVAVCGSARSARSCGRACGAVF